MKFFVQLVGLEGERIAGKEINLVLQDSSFNIDPVITGEDGIAAFDLPEDADQEQIQYLFVDNAEIDSDCKMHLLFVQENATIVLQLRQPPPYWDLVVQEDYASDQVDFALIIIKFNN